jgi:hypothetical protein
LQGKKQKGSVMCGLKAEQRLGSCVDGGKNIGDLYCVGVHFPSSGEVVYYVKDRVETVEGDTN